MAMVNSTYANEKASANDPECQRNSSTASSEKVSTLGVNYLPLNLSEVTTNGNKSSKSLDEDGQFNS